MYHSGPVAPEDDVHTLLVIDVATGWNDQISSDRPRNDLPPTVTGQTPHHARARPPDR